MTERALPRPKITSEMVGETRKAWQSMYPAPLSDDDCIEIISSAFTLFEVLRKQDDEPPGPEDQMGR